MIESQSILVNWSILVSLFFLIVSLVLVLIRFLRGPDIPDRIVAFDLLAVILMGFIIILSIIDYQAVYLDVAIIMALISFLGTVAYAKYLEKGVRK
jgi:multicomponent Na+:H+ antiporter subunit F